MISPLLSDPQPIGLRLSQVGALIAFLIALIPPSAHAQNEPRRRAVAQRTDTPPIIDGRLDDPAWKDAPSIGPLVQVEPLENAEPTEKTDVRILYDREHLYIGMRFYDSEPDRIISTERIRDAFLDADDRVEIVIDTFLDRRSAFFFQINPTGSKGDALIYARNFNKPWDGIWEGKSSIDDEGWIAEIALPFKTLNFREGLTTWGFNLERYIGRKRESCRWSGHRYNQRLFNIFQAGDLEGIEGIEQGVGLDVVPFYTAKWSEARGDDPRELVTGEPGLDAFYKITPNLTFSLTLNTDFAETEVDERRINLTRFPLFFPERRDFFLQDEGLFRFADLRNDLVPFFSRRVGLIDGQEVPIRVGAKLTGRAGPFNIGVMDVLTDSVHDLDEQNLFVSRLSYNLLEESSVGGIVTHGNPSGGPDNSLIGVDANFRTSNFRDDKILQGSAWFLKTDTEDESGRDVAFGASINYPNDIWSASSTFKEIRENFDPALGFVPRKDIRKYTASMGYEPRINDVVRQLEFSVDTEVITDLDNHLETVETEVQPLGINWDSGDTFRVEFEHIHEDLTEPFEISDGVIIDADEYDFARARIEFDSAVKRPLSFQASVEGGQFFDGDRTDYFAAVSFHPSALYTTSFEYVHNDVSVDGGDFKTGLSRFRLNISFSPDLSWNSFLQWDSVSDSIGLNSRIRWIPEPGREIFVVFNETLERQERRTAVTFHELAFKIGYTIRF